MISQRSIFAALAIALVGGAPVASALAAPVPGTASPAAAHETARRDLWLARQELRLGDRMAAGVRLERAETRVLNDRSAIQGQGTDSGPQLAVLDGALTDIEAARADLHGGKLREARHATTEALHALRNA